MPLDENRKKRDFARKRQPRAKKPGRSGPIFVVQEHHASRLHFDFRLEIGGVLRSWAIPKEPTLDPAVKRLAVQVEDHPIDYATFKGSIAEGLYGAGEVEIWDKGTFHPVSESVEGALDAGRLDFELEGKKLKGAFSLLRMRFRGRGAPDGAKDSWLLIKKNDRFARASGALELTHLEKVLFPELGATKKELVEYYRAIAPELLPYLKDRPLTLERLPEGISGPQAPHFWQKNTPPYYPDFIRRAELESDAGKPVHHALVDDVEGLLYLVNQGAMTFHVGFSRMGSLERPDFVLFDLDPPKEGRRAKRGFADAVEIARELLALLKERKLKAVIKTSGKSGLHLLVPWSPRDGGHDEARAWALSVAKELVGRCGSIATTERSKAARRGRVYVDVMQNALGHHAVPPFVVRAVPGATVSMLLSEEELDTRLRPRLFDLRTALGRMRSAKGRKLAREAARVLLGVKGRRKAA